MTAARSPDDVGAAIRAARRRRGWTQAELAGRAGVGRQWLVAVEGGHERAEIGKLLSVLRALDVRLSMRPGALTQESGTDPTRLTAAAVADAIRDELRSGDRDFALRLLGRALADLRSARSTNEVAEHLSEPPSTGDARWDTLIAAAYGRACRRLGVEPPAWTAARPLESWWFPVADPVLTARTMQRTPVDFAARGIWLDERALELV